MIRSVPVLCLALLATVVTPAAAEKIAEPAAKPWTPIPRAPLSDVPETEPNGLIATANALGCGNVLRPAAISPLGDEDYVSFTVQIPETTIEFATNVDGVAPVGDTYIALFDANGIQVAYDDDSGPGLYSLVRYVAHAPGTYFGMIRAYSATHIGSYKASLICLAPDLPLENDLCSGATPIGCGTFHLSGSTQSASNDYDLATPGGCTGHTAGGRDVVYVFTPPPGALLDVAYQSTANASIYIVTNCDDPNGTCVAGEDNTGAGGIEDISGLGFATPGPYYLILDSYGTNTWGTWTMTGTLTCATPARNSTWGQLKNRYR